MHERIRVVSTLLEILARYDGRTPLHYATMVSTLLEILDGDTAAVAAATAALISFNPS